MDTATSILDTIRANEQSWANRIEAAGHNGLWYGVPEEGLSARWTDVTMDNEISPVKNRTDLDFISAFDPRTVKKIIVAARSGERLVLAHRWDHSVDYLLVVASRAEKLMLGGDKWTLYSLGKNTDMVRHVYDERFIDFFTPAMMRELIEIVLSK